MVCICWGAWRSPNNWTEDRPNAADDVDDEHDDPNAQKIWIIYLQTIDETWQAIQGEM